MANRQAIAEQCIKIAHLQEAGTKLLERKQEAQRTANQAQNALQNVSTQLNTLLSEFDTEVSKLKVMLAT